MTGGREITSDSLLWTRAMLAECRLCPRQCRVNRSAGEVGWCGAGARPEVYLDYIHFGEDPDLNPSQAIYLKGCNLSCLYCDTAEERRTKAARPLTIELLAAISRRGARQGARNINFMGGEPTVNLPALLELFSQVPSRLPVVWNTNAYAAREAWVMADLLADVFLVDLKIGHPECWKALSSGDDYWGVVTENIKDVWRRNPEKLIVRHLVPPGHVECCTQPILTWVSRECPQVKVSLRLDYLVMPAARTDPHLGRFLSVAEAGRALDLAQALAIDLTSVYPVKNLVDERRSDVVGTGEGHDPLEGEIVIAPDGRVFLRHPNRELTELVTALIE